MARLTVFPVILLPCRQRVQIFFEPTMFRLKEWSSRYDAWVSAGGEVEEEGGGGDGGEEEYGDGGANIPDFLEHEDGVGDDDDYCAEVEAHVGEEVAEGSGDAAAAEPVFSGPGFV